jgi:hypothetical protein
MLGTALVGRDRLTRPLIAPVSEAQEVGFIRLTIDGKVVSRVPVITGGSAPEYGLAT